MRRVLLWTGALAMLGLTGCATSAHDMREAQEYQFKADQAAARGDYEKAAKYQRKAEHERREAYERSRYGM